MSFKSLSALRSSKKQPSPAYASVDQEEKGSSSYRSSEEEGIDTDGENLVPFITDTGRRIQKRFMAALCVNAGLFLVIIGLLVAQHTNQTPKKLLESPLPEFPKEVKTFKLDPVYLSLPTEESNKAWDVLHGPFQNGMGFIRLEEDDRFDFPDDKAGLSVFHQLHCLGALRLFMWNLMYDRVDTKEFLKMWPENVTRPTYEQATEGPWHFAHCFDYLRQSIQCSADVSLEFVSKNTGLAVVDGLDYPHECTNWDVLWDYAQEHA